MVKHLVFCCAYVHETHNILVLDECQTHQHTTHSTSAAKHLLTKKKMFRRTMMFHTPHDYTTLRPRFQWTNVSIASLFKKIFHTIERECSHMQFKTYHLAKYAQHPAALLSSALFYPVSPLLNILLVETNDDRKPLH
jgi:hypothetical protein